MPDFSWFATVLILAAVCSGCRRPADSADPVAVVQPRVITQPVPHDSDDPAIWINHQNPAGSLVLGTDKDTDGGLYAFDLTGQIVGSVTGLKRPNNVDILTDFQLAGKSVDIAVVTEREMGRLRIFRLPDLVPLDSGGLTVFEGEPESQPMGVAMYRRQSDQAVFAIVGRKPGPAEGYLWQYRLADDGNGGIRLTFARKFGRFSGKKEIEAIAVDPETARVFYSDERFGIREYHADPDAGDAEISVFGTDGFKKDREGISILRKADGSGSILVSDQDTDSFRVFRRGGDHAFAKSVRVAARESDGSEITTVPLGPDFPAGLFVAMSTDRTFHFYDMRDLLPTE